MTESQSFLESFIGNQRKAIRYHLVFASIVVGLGMTIIVAALFFLDQSINEPLKAIISIGGGFISSISAFPIKEIINRKERISVFESVQLLMQSTDKKEQSKVEELIWKAVEKIVLG